MPNASFPNLMHGAQHGSYAIGYFEAWNLESLLAVADAAEAQRAPVILGMSGIYLPADPEAARRQIEVFGEMGRAIIRKLSVPACLLFNESPYLDRVLDAIDAGFDVVMFSDPNLPQDRQTLCVKEVVAAARKKGISVEGEVEALQGVGGELSAIPNHVPLSNVEGTLEFINATGVNACAVNLGQVHTHGKVKASLNLERLREIKEKSSVPLVLHGASSIADSEIRGAVEYGIRKINVGSNLKRAFFDAVSSRCRSSRSDYNPYEIIGSGLEGDCLQAGYWAMRREVERYIQLFGSAGRFDGGKL